MPRSRRYQPIPDNVCEDRRLDAVSEGAQNLWFRLLSKCDDDGRFHGDPRLLKGYLYPLSDFSVETIKGRVGQLIDAGLIEQYRVEDEWFLRVQGYLTSSPRAKKIRFPGRPADHEAEQPGRPVAAEPSLFLPDPAPDQNGNRSLPSRYVKGHEPEPEPSPITPTPTPTRPDTGGDGSGRTGSAAQGGESRIGSESAGRMAQSERAIAQAAFMASSDPQKAAEYFAAAVLKAIKPDGATEADGRDVIALAFHVRGACPSNASWVQTLRAAWSEACSKAATGGQYGAWRVAMRNRHGDWRVASRAGRR